MVMCGFCGKEILEPKMNRNGKAQKFCNDKCRWDYHNRKKFERFVGEMMALLKKYKYLR